MWQVRFWSKVDKTGECWLWQGTVVADYGQFWLNGKGLRAHRVAWSIANGEIPEGLCVCHKCDTPLCMKPDHLFLGTVADNNHDRAAKGRSAHLRGETNAMAKLSDAAVAEIRALLGKMRHEDIAAQFGVQRTAVSRIARGRLHGVVVFDHQHRRGCRLCLSRVPQCCAVCSATFFISATEGRPDRKTCSDRCTSTAKVATRRALHGSRRVEKAPGEWMGEMVRSQKETT